MVRPIRTALLAGIAGVSLVLTTAGGSPRPPADPAPGGPQRPYAADVPGPRNLDGLTVTGSRERGGVAVTFDRTSRTAGNTVPAAARRFVFLFDRSLDFHLDRFPTCASATLAAGGLQACPPGAVVGDGVATAFGGAQNDVAAVNTRYADGSRGVIVYIPATGVVLEQTLERVTGHYRHDYGWALDEIFPITAVPPQDRPGTVRFTLTLGSGNAAGLLTRRGHDRSFKAGLWSEFVTGQAVLLEDRF